MHPSSQKRVDAIVEKHMKRYDVIYGEVNNQKGKWKQYYKHDYSQGIPIYKSLYDYKTSEFEGD